MAVKLSQLVDLAIGVDIPSVNFLHLREVLVTVISALDIGDVAVKKTSKETDCPVVPIDGEPDDNCDPLLSDDEEQESGTHVAANEDVQLDANSDDNENEIILSQKGNKSTVQNAKGKEGKDNELGRSSTMKEEHSTRTKSVKDSGQRGRHENIPSRASNVTLPHNTVLSGKILALEEGLKGLRNIVGDLISRGNFDGNLSNSLMEQLKEAARTAESVATLPVEEDNSSASQDVTEERSKAASALKRGSSRRTRKVSGKLTSKRPVTQPVLTTEEHEKSPPVPTRSKTADVIGGKKLSGRTSVLEKLKQRRRTSNIKEEEAENEGMKAGTTGDTAVTVKDDKSEKMERYDATVDCEVLDGRSTPGEDSSDESENDIDSDDEMEEMIENEIEAALNDPDGDKGAVYAVRLGLEQMQTWREKLLRVQEEFKLEVGTCKNSIQKMQDDLNAFRAARKAQDIDGFNAVHHVHGLVLELEDKHTKLSKTVNELVDEFNRHDQTFSDVFNAVEKLDEQKVDKLLLSSEVGDKANKDDLRDKVSVSTFDETFSLLDCALNDALEKMANQMSMEEALRETMNELQSGMESKLNREEMENLRDELENRIKEVRARQAKGQEDKLEKQGDPAGFKRKTEKVGCISCGRDMEIETSQVQVPPSIPKVQRLAGIHANKVQPSREGHVAKKVIDDEFRLSRIKTEMVQGTGLLDLNTFPMSQRYCGGSHTIIRANKRSMPSSHFNDYVVISSESDSFVSLPAREFIVSKETGMGSRHMKQKLPAINELKRLPALHEGGNYLKPSGDIAGFLPQEEELEKTKRLEKKRPPAVVGKIPVCETDDF